MPTPGLVRYIEQILGEELEKEKDQYARYTLGMLKDMLERIDYTVTARAVKTPPRLMSATVKVCAGAIAILIMEMSREDKEEELIGTALEQIEEDLREAIVMYRDCLGKGKKPTFL